MYSNIFNNYNKSLAVKFVRICKMDVISDDRHLVVKPGPGISLQHYNFSCIGRPCFCELQ